MNTTKICIAILVGSALIAGAVYAAITSEHRAFMDTCLATATSFNNEPARAEYLCAVQYRGVR
jgi:hypothetical protein